MCSTIKRLTFVRVYSNRRALEEVPSQFISSHVNIHIGRRRNGIAIAVQPVHSKFGLVAFVRLGMRQSIFEQYQLSPFKLHPILVICEGYHGDHRHPIVLLRKFNIVVPSRSSSSAIILLHRGLCTAAWRTGRVGSRISRAAR